MKTLLLMTKRRSVAELYLQDLNRVFRGKLNIHSFCTVDQGDDFLPEDDIAQADIVLITNPYSFPWARRQMRPDAALINLEFAFSRERVEALKSYPVGTETLACFNFYSSAHAAVYALYATGVTNLNLYIHYPGNQNLVNKHIDLALTAGPTDHIPEGIPQVFDLGDRHVSLTTMLDVAVKAGLLDDDTQDAIARYCQDISLPDNYVSDLFGNSSSATLELKAIMECIDYGIAIFDADGQVVNFNQSLLSLLGLPRNLHGTNLADWALDSDLKQHLLSDRDFRNQLHTLNNQQQSLTVSKLRIKRRLDQQDLFILLVKDITELTNLETSLRKQIAKRGHVARYAFSDILGDSPAIQQCLNKAKRIAQIDKPTLIIGESGTGKELFAQSIHNASSRANFPFVPMNCAAIPPTLLESELFGYKEGAFTGARRGGKDGLFQMAHKGTLFLDEIGELPLPTQAKLLRVLEEREIMKVGSEELTSVDVRIIAATNRDLNALVDEGSFRLDLYYRLNTLIINVPPLRSRRCDIPVLINQFLRQEGHRQDDIDPEVWDFLLSYDWKGNIRELRNCTEYMSNMSDGPITAEHLPDYIRATFETRRPDRSSLLSPVPQSLDSSDREAVQRVLALLKRHPSGRRTILQALNQEDGYMTEYRLRAILNGLVQGGYITAGRGRAGCSLTRAGQELLHTLSQGGEG